MEFFTRDYWNVPLGPQQVDRATVAVRIATVAGITVIMAVGIPLVALVDEPTAAQQPTKLGQLADSPRLQEFIVTGLVCVSPSGEKFSVSPPLRDDSALSNAEKCTLNLSHR